MKTLVIGISALALTLAGAAYAAIPADSPRGPDANRVLTRADVQSRAARAFERLDANHDGKIDRADREARQEGRRAARFDRLDTDHNGQISRSEFTAPQNIDRAPMRPGMHQRHMGGMRGGMMMGRKGGADGDRTNGSRALTQAEFTAAALQRFDRLDADRDGRVTREERQAARQRMRADRQTRLAPGGTTPPPAN